MPDHYTPQEFGRLMQPWASEERQVAEERMRTMYRRERLEKFSADDALMLEAVFALVIPQDEGIDLVGFLDQFADAALGRGDKPPGLPQGSELFRAGLEGLREAARARGGSFLEMTADQQEEILRQAEEGVLTGGVWDRIPSSYFFKRLVSKALHGYFSHPLVWMRIGFPGAAYPEGYSWVGTEQVRARHERHAGWDVL